MHVSRNIATRRWAAVKWRRWPIRYQVARKRPSPTTERHESPRRCRRINAKNFPPKKYDCACETCPMAHLNERVVLTAWNDVTGALHLAVSAKFSGENVEQFFAFGMCIVLLAGCLPVKYDCNAVNIWHLLSPDGSTSMASPESIRVWAASVPVGQEIGRTVAV